METLPERNKNDELLMSLINKLNKAFDHRIRLGIMSVLVVNDHADFKELKELLDVTDGNLASHAKALEKEDYIRVEKSFIGRKPNTKYIATEIGKLEFKKHIDALEKLISGS
jgi:DNA-binding MarR family transcriptional regulator